MGNQYSVGRILIEEATSRIKDEITLQEKAGFKKQESGATFFFGEAKPRPILFKVTVFYTVNVSPKAQRLLTDSRP